MQNWGDLRCLCRLSRYVYRLRCRFLYLHFLKKIIMQVWVEWFGEHTRSLVGRSKIHDLREGVMRRMNQKPLGLNLKRAVLQAIEAASKQVH